MLALPRSQPRCPPPCIALPNGEDWGSPMANKLAWCPVLRNTGWLSRCSAASTTVVEEKTDFYWALKA